LNSSTIHLNSLKSVRIEILSENTKKHLSWASGFLIEKNDKIFLVTNWHVVSGRNFETDNILHSSGAFPGFLNLFYTGTKEKKIIKVKTNEVPLYKMKNKKEKTEIPLWLEHPIMGSKIDVIALDITRHLYKGIKYETYRFNREYKNELMVMDNVFIIGFPLTSSTTPNEYPIYKGATVASEPNRFDKLPIFYVDGKTKEGMSGSPVVRKQGFDANFEKRNFVINRGRTDLIGIYSGRERQSKNENEAELGIVWRINECLIPILDIE
jgi:hypothetical protein